VQLIGADKILFGSDYPLLEQDHGFKEVKSSNLPEETINMILSGNALKLLGIN
jgi:predicted TIM-barrel fold metal-dependent hydrolase